jgi:hypothetical protein
MFKVAFVTDSEDFEDFVLPNFENSGLKLVSQQSSSQSTTWENGKRSFSRSVYYFLKASKSGIYTIGEAKMKSNDKVYTSKPVTFKIEKEPNIDVLNSDCFLVSDKEKENYLLNEPIAVTYKLYLNPKIVAKQFSFINESNYNNFNFSGSETNYVAELEEYNGKLYHAIIVKKDLVYPNKVGKFKFDSIGININIKKKNKAIKGKKPTFSIVKTKAFSNKLAVEINDLPEIGKPINYTNGFGKFEIKLIGPTKEIKNNKPFEVKVEISGEGNFGDLEFPELELPQYMDIVATENDTNLKILSSKKDNNYVDYSTYGIKGKVTITYILQSKKASKETLPSIAFSYFDPYFEKYETIESNQIDLDIK